MHISPQPLHWYSIVVWVGERSWPLIRQHFVLQLFCVFVFRTVFCILYTCRRGWGGLTPGYVEKKVGDSQLVTSQCQGEKVGRRLFTSGSKLEMWFSEKFLESVGQWVIVSDFGYSYRIYRACELVMFRLVSYEMFCSEMINMGHVRTVRGPKTKDQLGLLYIRWFTWSLFEG